LRRRSRSAAAITRSTSALLLIALCAGCGGTSSSSSSGGATTRAVTTAPSGPRSALGALLPQSIQNARVLRVATAGSTTALDRQLARATGFALGVAVKFVSTADAGAAVATGRADVGWAALPDTAAKRRGVTYVDYLRAPGGGLLGIAVKKGDAPLVSALQAALQHLRSDGTYGRVLAQNHAAKQGVTAFGVDGG
jgi:ABC-type amino acid transport substrate-binding protein